MAVALTVDVPRDAIKAWRTMYKEAEVLTNPVDIASYHDNLAEGVYDGVAVPEGLGATKSSKDYTLSLHSDGYWRIVGKSMNFQLTDRYRMPDYDPKAYVMAALYYMTIDSSHRYAVAPFRAIPVDHKLFVAYSDIGNGHLTHYRNMPWFGGWHGATTFEHDGCGSLAPFRGIPEAPEGSKRYYVLEPPWTSQSLVQAAQWAVEGLTATEDSKLTVYFFGPTTGHVEYDDILRAYKADRPTRITTPSVDELPLTRFPFNVNDHEPGVTAAPRRLYIMFS